MTGYDEQAEIDAYGEGEIVGPDRGDGEGELTTEGVEDIPGLLD